MDEDHTVRALAPLGYVMAVPICYCKPGTSARLKKRIEDKQIEFKNIAVHHRQIRWSARAWYPRKCSQQTDPPQHLKLNEIVHEEDILVKEGTSVLRWQVESQQTTT
jgi:hypothetical protein